MNTTSEQGNDTLKMTYRSSFPFLRIAKKYNVDYGLVLRYADWWDIKTYMTPESRSDFHRLNVMVRDEIITAITNEDIRRRQVQANVKS